MLDNNTKDNEHEPDKITLTQRPEPQVVPVCTVLSDGTVRVEGQSMSPLDLQRLLMAAAVAITHASMQRVVSLERMLLLIRQRFDGFDRDTLAALDTVFKAGQPH